MIVTTHFLEDDTAPRARRGSAPRRRPSGTRQLAKTMQQALPDVPALADELGFGEDSIALQIDRHLDTQVWNGTRFTDRTNHLTNELAKSLVSDIEKSLLAQERYEDFEGRLLKQLGIDASGEPLGALRDMHTQMAAEAKLAWNEGLVVMNQDADTVLVWRSALLPTTTAECWARHGVPVDEIGEVPLAHWGCLCDLVSVPDPNSDNEEWAALGQAKLDEMAAEKAGGPLSEVDREPSRLAGLRALWRPREVVDVGAWVHPAAIRSVA